jgi:hypothetical protein
MENIIVLRGYSDIKNKQDPIKEKIKVDEKENN